MTGTVLILGSSGRFGRHTAEAFWNRGWRVTLFDRETDDLNTAALGQDIIVNGWNPTYDRWADDVPALTERVIEAARTSGATVILPGNVYVFGDSAGPVLSETTPHAARNPLGQIRIDMEAAYRASGVPTILIRTGDFLDPEPSGNWFDKVMVAKSHKGTFDYPGDPDIDHAWAFLPDLARATVHLAEARGQLDRFSDIPFPGLTLTGRALCGLVADALDHPQRLRRMSWLPIQIARPVWPMARSLVEMRYLWSMPHCLSSTRFDALLPGFVETSASEAVASAVRHKIRPNEPVARSLTRVTLGRAPQNAGSGDLPVLRG